MTYRLILFDLDDTLLDFSRTQAVAFEAIVTRFEVVGEVAELYARYQTFSKDCWRRHEQGELSTELLRTERWRLTLASAGAQQLSHEELSEAYLDELPQHTFHVEGALEVCRALAEVVTVGVVTNGFESVQHRRLAASPLQQHVSFLLTSEAVGAPKPERAIFDRALELGSATLEDTLMIGDNLGSDIAGANGVCMDSVWFNPGGKQPEADIAATHTVSRLSELLELPRVAKNACALLLAVLSLAGCSGSAGWFRTDLDEWVPRTTVTTDFVVLHSPYGPQGTAHWAEFIDEQFVAVSRLYDVQHDRPLAVRMFPTPVENRSGETARVAHRWQHDPVHPIAGVARFPENEDANIALLVPSSFTASAFAELGLKRILRHELSHAMSRLAVGELPRFLTEGLATVVEGLSTDVTGGVRWNALVTERVIAARNTATAGSLEQLLSWQDFDGEGPQEVARYALTTSLVRYLLERCGTGSFHERLVTVVALQPGELRDAEGSWLEWLAALDPYDDLARAMSSDEAGLRIEALNRMHVWSQMPSRERSLERRFVDLALDALHDEETFKSAALALIDGAHGQLSQADIAPLATSDAPHLFLLGQALLGRHEQPLDRQAIERVWSKLDGPARWGIPWPVLEVLELEYGDLSGIFTLGSPINDDS
jgi:2-haloacid dehalogenase